MLLAACFPSFAQQTKAQLEVSETFFAVGVALNGCGYDAGLGDSLPLRQTIRSEVQAVTQKSPEAAHALDAICLFEKEHLPADASRNTAQYVSLAMELGSPPEFNTIVAQADLPPDAAYVLGVAPLLRAFYQAAGLHLIWHKHEAEYNALVERFHDRVSDVITGTDLYLKLPFSTYVGRRFVIYLEPMLAPTQVNSRNYGDNYYLAVSPARDGSLRLQEIRHTYLHYVLDPLALKHTTSLKRVEPILQTVQAAPLDVAYKRDIGLLVNECLIRAIEIRTAFPHAPDSARIGYVEHSMEEGFVLTRYFYDALAAFEKQSTGLKDAYGDFLYNIELDKERKRAREIEFASKASPEIVTSSQASREERRLDLAEFKLSAGDLQGARSLVQQVLQDRQSKEDPGRAFFIMARIDIRSANVEAARSDFEQAVMLAHDPRTLAWSHIYLGRIFDGEARREEALNHYRAALAAGDPAPDTKEAAEKGLAAPFAPAKPR